MLKREFRLQQEQVLIVQKQLNIFQRKRRRQEQMHVLLLLHIIIRQHRKVLLNIIQRLQLLQTFQLLCIMYREEQDVIFCHRQQQHLQRTLRISWQSRQLQVIWHRRHRQWRQQKEDLTCIQVKMGLQFRLCQQEVKG